MTIVADVMEWQHEFITASEKFLSLMGGRRCGKSHAIKLRMLNNCMYFPGFKVMYLSPSGSLCNEIFEDMTNDKVIKKRTKRVVKQPMRKIQFRNGSEIIFIMWSGDPNKLRGLGFDEVILDEIQSLETMQDRDKVLMIVRPLIMDRQGTFVVAGQYRGAQCWWHKMFEENKDDPDYKSWSIPSWHGWMFRDEGWEHPEIQLAYKTLPRAVFDQEIACIPTANQNAAIRPEDLVTITKGKAQEPKKKHVYAIGVDLGKTVDPSAWVVIDLNTGEIVHAELRRIGERHEVGAQKLTELSLKYNAAECWVDTTGGATGGRHDIDAYTRFYRERLPSMRAVHMGMKNKMRLIQNMLLMIEQHEISIPEEFAELIKQLEMYEFREDKWGNFSYSGPGGHQDDFCVALALAIEGYKISGFKTEEEKEEEKEK